ncbi:hypothetical protein Y1Q_0002986 [Alligator mississippiensis]|uniref:Uncharacterized protein n=1 Tax=Alligator mississippiensis TaxID=8496 RepID=A0A151MD17_ALLMI|nr:hypothetical protein Y1Q_0002986 [Alligator mississippiensis]
MLLSCCVRLVKIIQGLLPLAARRFSFGLHGRNINTQQRFRGHHCSMDAASIPLRDQPASLLQISAAAT